tara:strand:- start:7687 stop:8589 length:903 start_codon:yes stop_codon:yes gene_type:complete
MYTIDMSNPAEVAQTLLAGAEANRTASCRKGSIDHISAPGHLIASGDTHDHPRNFRAIVAAAGLDGEFGSEPKHLTLHEIIHPDMKQPLPGEPAPVDTSYRGLTRVAKLKTQYPEFVHFLLANHELAQATDSLIVKNGVRCVEAFNAGIDQEFPDPIDAESVRDAVKEFVLSMPIGLRASCPKGDILCTHSLPGPAMMDRFDTTIINRDLTEQDYEPRVGSAHLMTWGRGYDHEQLEDLTETWGINLFILGHEHATNGYALIEPNAIVLNTDHDKGVYLPIDLDKPPSLAQAASDLVHIH